MKNYKNKNEDKQDSISESNKENFQEMGFPLDLYNYKLLLIGLAIIVIGFILMAGGGSDDPNVFNEDIFSFRRVTLAPIVILAGFVFEIFAIMHKKKSK